MRCRCFVIYSFFSLLLSPSLKYLNVHMVSTLSALWLLLSLALLLLLRSRMWMLSNLAMSLNLSPVLFYFAVLDFIVIIIFRDSPLRFIFYSSRTVCICFCADSARLPDFFFVVLFSITLCHSIATTTTTNTDDNDNSSESNNKWQGRQWLKGDRQCVVGVGTLFKSSSLLITVIVRFENLTTINMITNFAISLYIHTYIINGLFKTKSLMICHRPWKVHTCNSAAACLGAIISNLAKQHKRSSMEAEAEAGA